VACLYIFIDLQYSLLEQEVLVLWVDVGGDDGVVILLYLDLIYHYNQTK